MNNKQWVGMSFVEDPDGAICGFCGKANDFADDCGWFYVQPFEKVKPCCKDCWKSEPGILHVKKYGLGER